MKIKLILTFFFSVLFAKFVLPQSIYQLQWEYHYTGFVSPMSLHPDELGRPYLYAASNEEGLRFFNIDGTPILSATLDTFDLFESVTNFTQVGNLLYVCLGHEGNDDDPGLAIVDITTPSSPVILGTWIHPSVSPSSGCEYVKIEGNYAYLGAMRLGLIILDISIPGSISFVSEYKPAINYPWVGPPAPDPKKINGRGLEVKNSIVYLCYDAGGVRIINCTNKFAPVETGRYCNPIVMGNVPRAYNNIILNDTVVYVTADYCGLEVLNIRDTSNITLLDSFNPRNCPTGLWWDSPVHFNEMIYNDVCKELFISGGKCEMISMDVSNPTMIDSTGEFGTIADTTGTWGIGMRNDSIFLSYIYTPAYWPWLPFFGDWGGIKMIKWINPCSPAGISEYKLEDGIAFNQPNPFINETEIHFQSKKEEYATFMISNALGQIVKKVPKIELKLGNNQFTWDGKDERGNNLVGGIYFIKIISSHQLFSSSVIRIQ